MFVFAFFPVGFKIMDQRVPSHPLCKLFQPRFAIKRHETRDLPLVGVDMGAIRPGLSRRFWPFCSGACEGLLVSARPRLKDPPGNQAPGNWHGGCQRAVA